MDAFHIKPLGWVSRSDGSHQEAGRRYEIEPDGKGWRLLRGTGGARSYLGYARDLSTAQAAAQSDHEDRLSADLEAAPAPAMAAELTALRAENEALKRERANIIATHRENMAVSDKAKAALRAEVERLREALQCAKALCDTPIGRRRLNLEPPDERLELIRAALTGAAS